MSKLLSLLLPFAFTLLTACTTRPMPTVPTSSHSPLPLFTPSLISRETGEAPLSVTTTPLPLRTPTPQPTATPLIALGEPKWLGRGQIIEAVFAPDGTWVAIGWANGISLSTVDGQERWWQEVDSPVIGITLHPRGNAVAALLVDGSILIVQSATGQAQRFAGAPPNIYWGDIAWSPDGARIAFQAIGPNRGDPIYLLDPANGEVNEVPESTIPEGYRPSLVWSPDGKAITLASLGEQCSRILDVESGETLLTLEREGGCYSAYMMAWSPDGTKIATIGGAGLVLLDAHSGEVIRTFERGEDTGPLLNFSADGKYLAAGGQNDYTYTLSPIFVWEVATGRQVLKIGQTENAYPALLGEYRAALGFDGETVLLLFADGTITQWPLGEKQASGESVGQVQVTAAEFWLVWSPDGSRLAVPNRYGGTTIWEVAAARLVMVFPPPFRPMAFSPDGRLIALMGPDAETGMVVNLDTGESVAALPGAHAFSLGAAFSPDGRWIAYGAQNQVILASALSGQQEAVLAGYPHEQMISRVIWAPDGDALIAASASSGGDTPGMILLWERAADGSFTKVFQTQSMRTGYEQNQFAFFNLSGKLAAFESLPSYEAGQFKVFVFDRETGKTILTLREYQLAGWASEDELLTFEAGFYQYFTLWNVRTRASEVLTPLGPGGEVFLPGTIWFANQSDTGPNIGRAVDIRNTRIRPKILRVDFGIDVMQILWSPDGRWLAALGSNGAIRLWPVVFP